MALGTQDNSSITCKRSEYHNLRRAQPPDMSVPITALQFFQHKTSCLLGTQLLRASRYTQDNSSISCRVTQSAMSTTTACHDIQSSSSVSPKRPACHNLANRLLRLQQTSITPTTRIQYSESAIGPNVFENKPSSYEQSTFGQPRSSLWRRSERIAPGQQRMLAASSQSPCKAGSKFVSNTPIDMIESLLGVPLFSMVRIH